MTTYDEANKANDNTDTPTDTPPTTPAYRDEFFTEHDGSVGRNIALRPYTYHYSQDYLERREQELADLFESRKERVIAEVEERVKAEIAQKVWEYPQGCSDGKTDFCAFAGLPSRHTYEITIRFRHTQPWQQVYSHDGMGYDIERRLPGYFQREWDIVVDYCDFHEGEDD